jgi:hypothetical protein
VSRAKGSRDLRRIPLFKMQNTVGVYYSGQDFSVELPAFFVDRQTARQWLQAKAAWSIHHGKDVALSSEMERWLAQDAGATEHSKIFEQQQSLVMGETIMRANAERERWAVHITRRWQRRLSLAEHCNSLRRYQQLNTANSCPPPAMQKT